MRARSGCSRRHGRPVGRSRARRGPEASRAYAGRAWCVVQSGPRDSARQLRALPQRGDRRGQPRLEELRHADRGRRERQPHCPGQERVEPARAGDRGARQTAHAVQGGPAVRGRDRHDPPLDRRGCAGPSAAEAARTRRRRSRFPTSGPPFRSAVRCPRWRSTSRRDGLRSARTNRSTSCPSTTGSGAARSTGTPTWSARSRSRPMARGSRLPAGRPAASGEVRIWDVQRTPGKIDRDDSGTQGRDPQRGVLAGRIHNRHRQLRQAREVVGRGHGERAPHAQGALGRRLQRRVPARRDAAGLRGRRPDAENLGRADAAGASSPSPTRSMPSTPWPFTRPARNSRRLAPIA